MAEIPSSCRAPGTSACPASVVSQGSLLCFLPFPQPWEGSSLLQTLQPPGTFLWNQKSALAAAAGF